MEYRLLSSIKIHRIHILPYACDAVNTTKPPPESNNTGFLPGTLNLGKNKADSPL
jgi:hypothetical protein